MAVGLASKPWRHTISWLQIDKQASRGINLAMSRRLITIAVGARHAALVVAVLATLMLVFGVHLHQAVAQQGRLASGEQCSDHHESHAPQHLASIFTSEHTAPRNGQGDDVPDPDGCGSCHCQMPSTTTAVLHPIPMFVDPGLADVARHAHDVLIPDSLSFEPDPPPIRG